VKLVRVLVALARGMWHLIVGWWTIQLHFPRWSPAQREARVQVWAAQLLAIWGIRLVVRGRPPAGGPVLLVSNHLSWLDILVLHAARHCRFVSKADVRRWPLVGFLATGAGTLYIEREQRRDAMRVVRAMTAALAEGDVLAIFPEGTTTDGSRLLPFHANLIQAAIAAQAPVQPVALRFADRGTGEMAHGPSYVDNDTLVGSVWRTLSGPSVDAVVVFGEPQTADGRDRRAWARDLRSAVEALREEAAPPGVRRDPSAQADAGCTASDTSGGC
jgi:1-acyl-sn-glycerol-3-phosphate acyltransferase